MNEKKSLTGSLEQAADHKLNDAALSRAAKSTGDLPESEIGGSGINPYGPYVERRRRAFEWLSKLEPRT